MTPVQACSSIETAVLDLLPAAPKANTAPTVEVGEFEGTSSTKWLPTKSKDNTLPALAGRALRCLPRKGLYIMSKGLSTTTTRRQPTTVPCHCRKHTLHPPQGALIKRRLGANENEAGLPKNGAVNALAACPNCRQLQCAVPPRQATTLPRPFKLGTSCRQLPCWTGVVEPNPHTIPHNQYVMHAWVDRWMHACHRQTQSVFTCHGAGQALPL